MAEKSTQQAAPHLEERLKTRLKPRPKTSEQEDNKMSTIEQDRVTHGE
ncbi:hypothetical protein PF003_g28878 [Phytophthora fragariae]|nr:hypothetical protein PF003_g28878 [Phytophthora fragariae]